MTKFGAEEKCCLYCLLMEEPALISSFCCFQKLLLKENPPGEFATVQRDWGQRERAGVGLVHARLCHTIKCG